MGCSNNWNPKESEVASSPLSVQQWMRLDSLLDNVMDTEFNRDQVSWCGRMGKLREYSDEKFPKHLSP